MTILEVKVEYNNQLKRYHKAVEYFERDDVTQVEKENNLDNYKQVLNNLNILLGKMVDYTPQEVLEGFKI